MHELTLHPSDMEKPTSTYQKKPSHHELLDVKEAAQLLRVTEKTIYRRVQAGLMPHRRFGPRLIRFTRKDILGAMTRRASLAEILG